MRLRARALYFEDAEGSGLALVSADLWSLPEGLADRSAAIAARRLGEDPDLPDLGRRRIVVAATHTHHSPAAYSSDRFFAMGAGPVPGFDPALHEWLAGRIAEAIVEAVALRRPARLRLASAPVDGVFRNRSMAPFHANPEAASILAENAGLSACTPAPLYPDPEACRAIYAPISALRIEESASRKLIAAALFVGVHPTAASHDLALYSGDVFGALSREAGRRLADSDGEAPVVAVFNGAQGDLSLTWEKQDRDDIVRLATLLADAAEGLLAENAGQVVDGPIEDSFARIPLAGREFTTTDGRQVSTSAQGIVGRATGAGAEDGPSSTPLWYAREGMTGPDIGPQGRKIGLFNFLALGGLTLPPFYFSRLWAGLFPPAREVDMGVYRLGKVALVTLPGEFTSVLGRRIRSAVARGLATPEDTVLAVGLAQSYAYYFTTPEEYDLQHYEGSGTMYGRESGALIEREAATLAGRLTAGTAVGTDTVHEFAFRPFPRRDFDLEAIGEDAAIEGSGMADAKPRGLRDRVMPGLCWRGPRPSIGEETPRPRLERRGSAAAAVERVADDNGLDLAVTASPLDDDLACWCVRWVGDREEAAAATSYRFVIPAVAGSDLEGPWFAAGTTPEVRCPSAN